MRIALKLLILLLALPALGQQTNRFPLNRAYLQGDLDGGSKNITNVGNFAPVGTLFNAGGSTFNSSGVLNLNTSSGGILWGPAAIFSVNQNGVIFASNYVAAANGGQFIGNGGGLSNVPATSIVGAITNISGYAGNLTNILRGYITPFDVGAVGDGSTDDTAALRKWLFIACSSNWIAFLPPAPGGFYKITDVLQITNGMNNVTIQGTGGPIFDGATLRSSSQIKQFGAGKDGIVVTNVVSGIKMRDFLITHNTYSYATRGIAFDGNNGDSDCSFIEGVGIQGFGRGLSLSSVADFQAKGCAFQLNGDGVFVGAGTYTQSGVVENNLLFASCQISYNRTNNFFATAGTITLLLDDIAQADDGTSQMLSSVGLRVTNAFVTAVSCNFENDIGAGTAQPCIIAGGSSGGGQLTLRGGGSQGQGGANGYTLKATNINVYIDANFNAGAVASDTYGIYEDVSVNGGSLIRSAVLMPFKANLNSTVYDGRTSLFMREWWGGHSALSKTETLWQDHSGWIDSNGVSQGGFDDLNSFLIGARMYGYQGGDNGIKEVDLLQYAKDKVSQMPLYNLYASNALLIGSNTWANIGTRIANMIKGDVLVGSSNGVPVLVTSDPSGTKTTNYFALSVVTKPPADATKYLDGTGAYSVPVGNGIQTNGGTGINNVLTNLTVTSGTGGTNVLFGSNAVGSKLISIDTNGWVVLGTNGGMRIYPFGDNGSGRIFSSIAMNTENSTASDRNIISNDAGGCAILAGASSVIGGNSCHHDGILASNGTITNGSTYCYILGGDKSWINNSVICTAGGHRAATTGNTGVFIWSAYLGDASDFLPVANDTFNVRAASAFFTNVDAASHYMSFSNGVLTINGTTLAQKVTNHIVGKSYALIAQNTTSFWAPQGNAVTNVQTSDVDMQSRQAIGTGFQVVGIWVKASQAAGAGQNYTITVMTNGVATALAPAISGASATTASQFTSIPIVEAQGDSIGVKIVTSATATTNTRFDWDVMYINQ